MLGQYCTLSNMLSNIGRREYRFLYFISIK